MGLSDAPQAHSEVPEARMQHYGEVCPFSAIQNKGTYGIFQEKRNRRATSLHRQAKEALVRFARLSGLGPFAG